MDCHKCHINLSYGRGNHRKRDKISHNMKHVKYSLVAISSPTIGTVFPMEGSFLLVSSIFLHSLWQFRIGTWKNRSLIKYLLLLEKYNYYFFNIGFIQGAALKFSLDLFFWFHMIFKDTLCNIYSLTISIFPRKTYIFLFQKSGEENIHFSPSYVRNSKILFE